MSLYADAPADLAHFDYTAIEPAYDVFGWRVARRWPVHAVGVSISKAKATAARAHRRHRKKT